MTNTAMTRVLLAQEGDASLLQTCWMTEVWTTLAHSSATTSHTQTSRHVAAWPHFLYARARVCVCVHV